MQVQINFIIIEEVVVIIFILVTFISHSFLGWSKSAESEEAVECFGDEQPKPLTAGLVDSADIYVG